MIPNPDRSNLQAAQPSNLQGQDQAADFHTLNLVIPSRLVYPYLVHLDVKSIRNRPNHGPSTQI